MHFLKFVTVGAILVASVNSAALDECVTKAELNKVQSMLQEEMTSRVGELGVTVGEKLADHEIKLNSILKEQRRLNDPVAFLASNDEAQTVADGAKFQFNTIHTNAGNGFSTPSDFVCPINGYYLFSFSLLGGSNNIQAKIVIDSTAGPRVLSGNTAANGSGTFALYCSSGSVVSVVQDQWNANGSGAGFQANFCSFSGILINAA